LIERTKNIIFKKVLEIYFAFIYMIVYIL